MKACSSVKRIGSKAEVLHGSALQTEGGLTAKDLCKVNGRIHSKKMIKRGKDDALKNWREAVKKAKRKLGIVKGDSFDQHVPKKGTELYDEAKKLYKKM